MLKRAKTKLKEVWTKAKCAIAQKLPFGLDKKIVSFVLLHQKVKPDKKSRQNQPSQVNLGKPLQVQQAMRCVCVCT